MAKRVKTAKKAKKEKPVPIDGLSPNDLKRVRQAVRQVWSWSVPWRIAKKRATSPDGFVFCENKKCPYKGKPVPKVFVDHIDPVGEVTGPRYIKRLFIPSRFLQCLCKKCHDVKTKAENQERAGKDVNFY